MFSHRCDHRHICMLENVGGSQKHRVAFTNKSTTTVYANVLRRDRASCSRRTRSRDSSQSRDPLRLKVSACFCSSIRYCQVHPYRIRTEQNRLLSWYAGPYGSGVWIQQVLGVKKKGVAVLESVLSELKKTDTESNLCKQFLTAASHTQTFWASTGWQKHT